METQYTSGRLAALDPPEHKRTKPSVLKSIITSKTHKRSPSDGDGLPQITASSNSAGAYNNLKSTPITSSSNPSAQQVLGEISRSNRDNMGSPKKSLRKKSNKEPVSAVAQLSSVSMHGVVKEKGRHEEDTSARLESSSDKSSSRRPKKTKSSTSLSGLLAKAKGSKSREDNRHTQKDKENTTPPSSAVGPSHTPIWAQFASQPYQEVSTTAKVALNDSARVEKEISSYTPDDYSPSKQRNFFGHQQPSLPPAGSARPRPKSFHSMFSTSTSAPLESDQKAARRERAGSVKGQRIDNPSSDRVPRQEKPSSGSRPTSVHRVAENTTSRGGKVMAAVAAFDGKARATETDTSMDSKSLDAAFEAVLVCVL